MAANERQVDGSHYKGKLQHWDIVHQADLDYFQAQILRYIMRHRKKHGLLDLQKAQHFIEKYIELEYPEPELAEAGNFDSACKCSTAWIAEKGYHRTYCPHYVMHGGEVPQGYGDGEEEGPPVDLSILQHYSLDGLNCIGCNQPWVAGHTPGCVHE